MKNNTIIALLGILITGAIINVVIFPSKTTEDSTPVNSTEKSEPALTKTVSTASKIFYAQSVVNLRSCESVTCTSFGTYPVNNEFTLPYENISDLPEWVKIDFTDDKGATKTGYINKVVLGDKKVVAENKPKSVEKVTGLPELKKTGNAEADAYLSNLKTLLEKRNANQGCKLKAEGILNSSWIRSCSLQGLLTTQCQTLFNEQGYYKNFPEVGDPDYWAKYNVVINDITACECQLPSYMVNQLKSTQQNSNNACDQLYPLN